MNTPFLSVRLYAFLFALLGLVYVSGLFVPLIDNDSAHHANIALRMYLTGNYVDLYDNTQDYLDKPHLFFWLCAFSYKVFGVTTFAYKFPSFLFTILGTYSVYRLGKSLYNKEVGRLASLMIASAFAYVLANNDVRMDTILTACIALAAWQLVEFVDHKKLLNVAGASAGLALGFCTKGLIAVFTPALAVFFYILYKKDWRVLFNWRWSVLFVLFGVLIFPVLYCYYLQFNLHPEKIVRGKDHINGVQFILFGQSIERFNGGMGDVGKNNYLFFFHSFSWAFAPWSVLAMIAFIARIKNLIHRREEWLTTGTFTVLLVLISLSEFKLPHYLNITFPVASLMAASFILTKQTQPKWIKIIFRLQLVLCVFLLLLSAVVNAWIFPVKSGWVIAGMILLLALVFYFARGNQYNKLQKAVTVSVSTMVFLFFLLNTSFYPRLLTYQGGNELAFVVRKKINPASVYFEKNSYSPSFIFYTASLRKPFSDSLFTPGKNIWLFTELKFLPGIEDNYLLGKKYEATRYWISRLSLKFLNPATRAKQCTKMLLVELKGRK